jgi:thioredoxin reductase
MTEHTHPPLERSCDVAVVGGSAAGLAAALQVARQRRSVIVIDDGTPRNAPAGHVHGYLAHEGLPPAELIAAGRAEVRAHGGEVLAGRVRGVYPADDGRFRVEVGGGHAVLARRVLAATGLTDVLPDIEGLAEHWGRDVIHCPFCHGFEVRDRRLVMIVTHPMGLHPAPLFGHLAKHLTVVLHDATGVEERTLDALATAETDILRVPVRRVATGDHGRVTGVELSDGQLLPADAVVIGPRFRARAEAFAPIGLRTSPHPSGLGEVLEVDAMGQTSVPGVYAAGNVTDPSLQVLQAAAHGSRVGAMIASGLAGEDLGATVRRSGDEADWDLRYGGDAPVWSGNPNGSLVREVASMAPGRALDVGAGEGGDAVWLAERGWQVAASDISARALARVAAEAERRDLPIACLHRDANALDAFEQGAYDLVSMQYGSVHRTPDQRALHNLLDAVAVGGTLLVVGHDLSPLRTPIDLAEATHMYDPTAYLGIDEIADALASSPAWEIEVRELRPRPPGAASTQHVDDVVLRARRIG